MAFPLLKIAALGLLGWACYRSYEAAQRQAAQDSESEGADGQEGHESAPAQAESAPAKKASAAESPAQDLGKIRGIGPAIAALLNARGITTWAQLAAKEASELQAILDDAGPRFRVHDPSTWPAQAAELAEAN